MYHIGYDLQHKGVNTTDPYKDVLFLDNIFFFYCSSIGQERQTTLIKEDYHEPWNLVILPKKKKKEKERTNWSVNPAARSLANGCPFDFSFSSCLHTCARTHCGAPMCQMITPRIRQVSLRISRNAVKLIGRIKLQKCAVWLLSKKILNSVMSYK